MMMQDEMMQGMGWMMGGMVVLLLLVVGFLITGIVFFVRNTNPKGRVGPAPADKGKVDDDTYR